MSPTTPDTTKCNGANVTQLTETIGAIQKDPALVSFRFRATTAWLGGSHSRSEIKGFWGAGTEDRSGSWGATTPASTWKAPCTTGDRGGCCGTAAVRRHVPAGFTVRLPPPDTR